MKTVVIDLDHAAERRRRVSAALDELGLGALLGPGERGLTPFAGLPLPLSKRC